VANHTIDSGIQEYQLYRIVNDNLVKGVLNKYEESFREKTTNAYYEMFGQALI